jgi:hypothetical protein
MQSMNPSLLLALAGLPDFWAGLTAITAGMGLGYLLRFGVFLRQRRSLRVAASLWEWARQRQDDDLPAADHARRIQRYYRQLQRYRHPERLLAAAFLLFSMAMLALGLFLLAGGPVMVQWRCLVLVVPVFLVMTLLALVQPWFAGGGLLIILAGTVLSGLGSLDSQLMVQARVLPGERGPGVSVPVGVLQLTGDPSVVGQGRMRLYDQAGHTLLDLPWQEPFTPVQVRLDLKDLAWPMALGLYNQSAWRLSGLQSGASQQTVRHQSPLELMVWSRKTVFSPPIATTGPAGRHYRLVLQTSGTWSGLYVDGPIADN